MQAVTLRLKMVAGRCGDRDATRWHAMLLFDKLGMREVIGPEPKFPVRRMAPHHNTCTT
jgi:hypothetical protein